MIKKFFDLFFGNIILKLRLRSLHKYSAKVYRLDKSIQRSGVSSDVKSHSAALAKTYVGYVALLSVGASPDFDSIMRTNSNAH